MATSRFGGQVISVDAPSGTQGVLMPPPADGQKQDPSVVEGMTPPANTEMLAPPDFMGGQPSQAYNPPPMPTPQPRQQGQSRFGGKVVNDIQLPPINPALVNQLPESIRPEMSDGSLSHYAGMAARATGAGILSLEDLARNGVGLVGKGMIGLTYLSSAPARALGFDTSGVDELLKTWDDTNTKQWMGSKAESFKEDIDALTGDAYKPQGGTERAISTGIEFIAGGFGPTALLGKAAKAGRVLEEAGQAAQMTATQRAGQFLSYQSLNDVAAAGGAGVALQVAQDNDLGPVSQIVAPFAGAFAGFGAAAAAKSAYRGISNPTELLMRVAKVSPEQLAKQIDTDVLNAAEATGTRLTPDAAVNSERAKWMMQKLNSMGINADDFHAMMGDVDQSFLKSYQKQLDTISADSFASADEAVQSLKPELMTAEKAAEARVDTLYKHADMLLPEEASHFPTNTVEFLKKRLGRLDESLLPSRDEASVAAAFRKLHESLTQNKLAEGIKSTISDLDRSIASQSSQLKRAATTQLADELETSIAKAQSLKDTLASIQPLLNDAMFTSGGIKTITDSAGNPLFQVDPLLVRQSSPKVKQLTATIRSLNQTIAWDDEVRGVKELLEGLKHAIKNDLTEYGAKNERWFDAWTNANKTFGSDVGERFRTGVVRSMITGEKPKAILSMLNSSGAVKAFDKAMAETESGKKVAEAIKRFKLEEILGKRLQNATTEDVQYGQFAAAMNPSKKEEVALIQALAGEQYTQLKNLNTVAQALATSFARYGNPSRTGNRVADFLFPQDAWAQTASAIAAYAGGGLMGVAGYGLLQAAPRMMARQLTDPKYMKLMKDALTATVKREPSAATNALREMTYWYHDTMKELGEGPILRFSKEFRNEFKKARGERKGQGSRLYSGLPIQDLVEITEDAVRAGYVALKPSQVVLDDMANTDIGGGFASTIGKALNGLKTGKATGRQWKVELEKAGARPEEMAYTYVGPFLEQNADKVMSRSAVKQMVEFSKPDVQLVGLAERLRTVNPEFVKEKSSILEARKKLDAEFSQEYADVLGVGKEYADVMERLGGYEKTKSAWIQDSWGKTEEFKQAIEEATVGGKEDKRRVLQNVINRAMRADAGLSWDDQYAIQKVTDDMGMHTPTDEAKNNAKKVIELTKSYAEKSMMTTGSKQQDSIPVKPVGLPIEGKAQYGSYTAQRDQNLFENKYELLVKFQPQQVKNAAVAAEDFGKAMFEKYGREAGVGGHMLPGQMEKIVPFMNQEERLVYDFMHASDSAASDKSYQYASPHFNDQGRDLLAHARVNVTPDAQGNRMLVIDEVQSDLHNAGRDKGYVSSEGGASMRARVERAQARIDELQPDWEDLKMELNDAEDALSNAQADLDAWVEGDYLEEANKILEKNGMERANYVSQARSRLIELEDKDVPLPEEAKRIADDLEGLRQMYMEKKKELNITNLESDRNRIQERFDEIDSEMNDAQRIADGEDVHGMDDGSDGAPDTAPLRNTWSEMLVRRAIKFAVDNGIDKVGITSGREQAARWNLGQWVRNVVVMPKAKIDLEAANGFANDADKILVRVTSKDGNSMNLATLERVRAYKFGSFYAMNREELASVFGKARADKMMAEADAMWPKVEETFTERKDMPFTLSKGAEKTYKFSELKDYVNDTLAAEGGDDMNLMRKASVLSDLGEVFMTTLQPKAVSVIDDSNFMVGGDGRVKAYDEILMRSVNKLLRKYGGDDATREAVPTRIPESVYSGLANLSENQRFAKYSGEITGSNATPQTVEALNKLGIPVTLEDLAQNKSGSIIKHAIPDPENTAETWTFRIPEKLKEEYRKGGVPFFAIPALVGTGAAGVGGQE